MQLEVRACWYARGVRTMAAAAHGCFMRIMCDVCLPQDTLNIFAMSYGTPGGAECERVWVEGAWLRGAGPTLLSCRAHTVCAAQEHVTNCRTSAQHAVASILAPDTVGDYDYLPFFYSRVFNLSWQARDPGRCSYSGVFC